MGSINASAALPFNHVIAINSERHFGLLLFSSENNHINKIRIEIYCFDRIVIVW